MSNTATWGAGATADLYRQPRTGADLATDGKYVNRDGFDLIWRQKELGDQMSKIEDDIRAIEKNANLSDTEKMFAMQMAMNTWSAVSNLRTNMLKSVADTLKSIARNVA
ncbi:EscF/YscF/HrpA family type III secretion system needle major subunit [Aureimonas jatrophae]|jgi:type III secretion protein F|uniref:Type III secretion apparatus needle protein n=1 Tax=Aureimonas jatrophae TaxID=1166073 RepID=A0A1H0EUG4_9HYPH|nr:EscF/YscF/HrpA family type III secretion system needle major subunit [Aureimonas jatrophae]MBB3950307.1 type III secretion apparatus needle protein [Aureimonas jatrophae]SDN86018.1 type III secretion apparatus needle protein [Aureimonas jatrophae]